MLLTGRGGGMVGYRAYIMGKDDHIVGAHVIKANTDDEAVRLAKIYVDDGDVEVWQAARKVARLPCADSAAPPRD
jgi:hypothetical protein